MSIALIHQHKAFLSEIHGYARFFEGLGIRCEAVTPRDLQGVKRKVDWYFMGLDRSMAVPGIFRIHDYLSPSTPPFRGLKDWGKSLLNARPDLRIFKNQYTEGRFSFRDQVASCIMGMGISDEWLGKPKEVQQKEYDFIYVGDLSPARKPRLLLDRFTKDGLRERSLLLLSRNYEALQLQYAAYPNILFKGPVHKDAVKEYIRQARYGINYIPDRAPFHQLPSTKFLEYASCGIPVISTSYAWAKDFAAQSGGRFLFVAPDLQDLTWEKVTAFDYLTPDMTNWTWEAQIRKSGVLPFLQRYFPDIRFT